MREIKFRAWHKKRATMCHFDIKTITKTIHPGYYYTEDLDGFDCELDDPNLYTDLMQYTGLKDKNGKEIYEGDILLVPNYPSMSNPNSDPDLCEVVYDSGSFGYRQGGMIEMFYSLYGNGVTQIDEEEVIGNIYENPELLKD